jgi:hypothetical protein
MNYNNVLIDLVKKYRQGTKDNTINVLDYSTLSPPTGSFVDVNSTQDGPSISTYQKPSIDITVIDFKRVSNHFGWAISFKMIDEQHRNHHLDNLPTNKALIADNGNWYEFDNDKLGSMVENPEIKRMIVSSVRAYLRDMTDSLTYIEQGVFLPKGEPVDYRKILTAVSHSIVSHSIMIPPTP